MSEKSKRQRIMDELAARVKGISTGTGYLTNMGSRTYPWRVTPFEESEMPCTAYKDTTDEKQAVTFGEEEHTLHVLFLFFAKGADAADQVRAMIADLTKAVWSDPTFGGLAEHADEEAPNEMDAQQREYLNAAAIYKLGIIYTTDVGDPEVA